MPKMGMEIRMSWAAWFRPFLKRSRIADSTDLGMSWMPRSSVSFPKSGGLSLRQKCAKLNVEIMLKSLDGIFLHAVR